MLKPQNIIKISSFISITALLAAQGSACSQHAQTPHNDKDTEPVMEQKIHLSEPQDGATVSFLSPEQKAFFSDPYRVTPHTPEIEPRKTDLSIPVPMEFVWEGDEEHSGLQISRRRVSNTVIEKKAGAAAQYKAAKKLLEALAKSGK